LAILYGSLLAAEPNDPSTKTDIEKWQGEWRVASMENNGQLAPPDSVKKITLTVTGTDYHFKNGPIHERGTYKFHADKNPKELDIVVGDGKDKGKVHLAIYKVDADELVICLDGANRKRPKELSGKFGSGCVLEVWRRSKPEAAK
jgi:uncharacterized protein (TIGR03067 family)